MIYMGEGGNVLEIISSVIAPFLHNPQIMFLIVIIIVGTDAFTVGAGSAHIFNWKDEYGQEHAGLVGFSVPQIFDLSGTNSKDLFGRKVCGVTVTGITLCGTKVGNEVVDKGSAEGVVDTERLGFFGGTLTSFFNFAGINIKITSFMLFFLMLLAPFIVWIATHKLGIK